MAGRKSKYETHVKSRFNEIIKWCKRGATDKEIYKSLGISKDAFYKYKKEFIELNDLIKKNRIDAVEEIKSALFKRATGFQYTETKVTKQYIELPEMLKMKLDEFSIEYYEKPMLVKTESTEKQVVPDPASALILLKHWAKDEGWTNDPQSLDIKKQELKLKEKQAENENW